MTKEQLTSEGMSSKIRKAIGYIKTPDEDYEDKYLNSFEDNYHDNIDDQIHNFLSELCSEMSPLYWFKIESLSEDQIIEFALMFLQRKDEHRKIIYDLTNLSMVYDYKGIYYRELDIKRYYNIYADYKSLVFSFPNIADCEYLSSDEKEIMMRASLMIHKLKGIVNQATSTYHNDFIHYMIDVKKITYQFFQLMMTETTNQKFINCLLLEISIDYVEILARTLLMYFPRFYYQLYPNCSGSELFAHIQEYIKAIHNVIAINVREHEKNYRKQSTIDEQIERFVWYEERSALYDSIRIIDCNLLDSMANNPEGYAFSKDSYSKIRERRNKIALSRKNSQSKKTPSKDETIITSIENLINASFNHFNLTLYFCDMREILYREIYLLNEKSPISGVTAKSIIRQLAKNDYSDNSDTDLPERKSDLERFKEKREFRQKLVFLDEKFLRGYFLESHMVSEYPLSLEIMKIIRETMLMLYGLIDRKTILQLLSSIADDIMNSMVSIYRSDGGIMKL